MVAGSGCGGAVVLCCIQYYPGPVLPVVAVLSYPLAGGRRTSGELAVAAKIKTRPSESEQRERLSQLIWLLGISKVTEAVRCEA